ncbi:MAG TPA: hypothetical protein VGS07_17950 [Thermoanaerobaculia bacterium]|jgi:hypothetical protein|nr:hypothetical protein [Thermoanaerobaculia bacterium]
MTEAEDAARQARVVEFAAGLEAFTAKLQEFHDSIPVSALEALMLVGEEEMDFATSLRSTIECVLADQLKPALVELRKEAAAKPPSREER